MRSKPLKKWPIPSAVPWSLYLKNGSTPAPTVASPRWLATSLGASCKHWQLAPSWRKNDSTEHKTRPVCLLLADGVQAASGSHMHADRIARKQKARLLMKVAGFVAS